MGYTTNFAGSLTITPALDENQVKYINDFSSSRRMRRNATEVAKFEDPVRVAVGLPVGNEGEYYVGSADKNFGQDKDTSIMDYNRPPLTQPGLWCQWVVSDDGQFLEWDENEKFYYYTEWMKYIIEHFFIPWGKVLNGTIKWSGEDDEDFGMIVIIDNVVTEKEGRIVYD